MGKCVKNIALSVMAAIFGALALSGPVFATPTPDTTTPETTETTTVEQPAETPAETETTTVSCYDQVGSLGWIICPGAGLFGNVIDGAYDLLTQIIEVNPIPTDNNSPTHVVWSYFKDITNSLFIVFLLVIILSQLTGFGINNYGIKKALPRIVIAAILVNLSYIICTVAVDLSNILDDLQRNKRKIQLTGVCFSGLRKTTRNYCPFVRIRIRKITHSKHPHFFYYGLEFLNHFVSSPMHLNFAL